MGTLQVRDLPVHLHRRLRALAKRNHRSLAQQVVALLERVLEEDADPRQRRRELLKAIRAEDPVLLGGPDPCVLVREDRDR